MDGCQVYCFLNNLGALVNNNAVFKNDSLEIIYDNTLNVINNAVYDPDGDSITIEFTNPIDSTGYPIQFMTGYSVTQPIVSNPPMTLYA